MTSKQQANGNSEHTLGSARESSSRPTTTSVSWDPATAWRISRLYGPLARAVRALVAQSTDGGGTRRSVLVVGGSSDALEGLLAAGSPISFDIRSAQIADEPSLPYADGEFDFVVGVDTVGSSSPSTRAALVRELCRVARNGLVVAEAFESTDVVAAERALNGAFRAAFGADHPRLGRRLELGLPDEAVVREWVSSRFAAVTLTPIESLEMWRSAESLDLLAGGATRQGTPADIAAAAGLPSAGDIGEDGVPYYSMLIAAPRPVYVDLGGQPPLAAGHVLPGLLMQFAHEAAAQRRAFEHLEHTVTTAREREREEFRAAAQSLALELREREVNAEFLAREIRKRDELLADQHEALQELERRIRETSVHARNMEAQAANFQRDVEDIRRVAASESVVRDAEVRELEMQLEAATGRAQIAEERVASTETALQEVRSEYDRLLTSRGGRALTRYAKLKRTLRGPSE